MKTARDLANALINKAKSMQTFRIMQPVPDDFEFGGVVPFDISIRNEIMTCTVHALTIEEAREQVRAWLQERTEGDW